LLGGEIRCCEGDCQCSDKCAVADHGGKRSRSSGCSETIPEKKGS
jgi:hypothetical protein